MREHLIAAGTVIAFGATTLAMFRWPDLFAVVVLLALYTLCHCAVVQVLRYGL